METRAEPTCPNCGAFADGAAYCPGCGQRLGEEVLSFRHWLGEVAEDYFSLDGRVPRSVVALLFRPGFLTREWYEGRRASHTRPARLCLATAILFFAVLLTGSDVQVSLGEETLAGAGLVERALPLAFLAGLPVLARVVELLEGGSGRRYMEHLVFVGHLQAFFFLVMTPMVAPAVSGLGSGPLKAGIYAVLGGYAAIYPVVALRRVYGDPWEMAGLKAVVLGFAYLLVVPIAAALISAAIALLVTGLSAIG